MKDPRSIVISPVITEKATAASAMNQYVFKVDRMANRIEIGKAVEAIFNVRVLSVRTMIMPGKKKRVRSRVPGRTAEWKKAVVRLREGDRIELA